MEVLFWISFLVSLAGTVILVASKNAVYALLGLLVAFGASAGIFLALDAPFIAVSQILIYAGALAVMFLFVLMFTDTRNVSQAGLPKSVTARPNYDLVDLKKEMDIKESEEGDRLRFLDSVVMPKPMAVVVALGFLVCLTFAVAQLPDSYNSFGELPVIEQNEREATNGVNPNYDTGATYKEETADGAQVVERRVEYGSTEAVSFTIFEGFPLAFEIVSLLIFAAILGAVLLARRHLVGIPGGQDVQKPQGDETADKEGRSEA